MGALCSFTKKRGSIRFLLGNEGFKFRVFIIVNFLFISFNKSLITYKKKRKKKEGFKFDAGH